MNKPIVVSIDAMGGDAGPQVVIPGVERALERHDNLTVLLFGDSQQINALLDSHPRTKARATVEHCDVSIAMDAKPSQALRAGRRVSSMWRAIEAVKTGQAQATVSAGNTGALMAMAKVVLNTMPDISRPAIAGIWPTLRGESIVLDVGATIGADAEQLVNFAIMGEAMARTLGIAKPSVGLLNVGVEEVKGIEEVKAAGRILRDSGLPFEYYGFVEGDDIGKGTVDVVVTEGFTGNIALKTAEGTAKQIATLLREAISASLMSRIGYLFARGAFDILRKRLDPRNSNGGVFLGLNGIVVKSHGGTDAMGFANAVDIAMEMASNDIVSRIARDMQALTSAKEDDVTAAQKQVKETAPDKSDSAEPATKHATG